MSRHPMSHLKSQGIRGLKGKNRQIDKKTLSIFHSLLLILSLKKCLFVSLWSIRPYKHWVFGVDKWRLSMSIVSHQINSEPMAHLKNNRKQVIYSNSK